jgi:hypothetical protein
MIFTTRQRDGLTLEPPSRVFLRKSLNQIGKVFAPSFLRRFLSRVLPSALAVV